MNPCYLDLEEHVEAAGLYTTSMPLDDGGDRIVIATKKTEYGLTGNSIWVASRQDQWFLGVWSGRMYQIPDAQKVGDLCVNWLQRESHVTRGDVEDFLRDMFDLVEVDGFPG